MKVWLMLLASACACAPASAEPPSNAGTALLDSAARACGPAVNDSCQAFVQQLPSDTRLPTCDDACTAELARVLAEAPSPIAPSLGGLFDSGLDVLAKQALEARGQRALQEVAEHRSPGAWRALVALANTNDFHEPATAILRRRDDDEHAVKWLVANLTSCLPIDVGTVGLVYRVRAAPFVAALLPVFDEQLERNWKAAVWTATVLGALGEPSAEPALLEALRQRRSWSLAGEAALALSRLKRLSPAGRTALGEIARAHWSSLVRAMAAQALRDVSDEARAGDDEGWVSRKRSDAEARLHLPDPPEHGNVACGTRGHESAWHVAGTDLLPSEATPGEFRPGQRLRSEHVGAVRALDPCLPLDEVRGRTISWSPDREWIILSMAGMGRGEVLELVRHAGGWRARRLAQTPGAVDRARALPDGSVVVADHAAQDAIIRADGAVDYVECVRHR